MIMTEKEAVDFFSKLGGIIDAADAYGKLDEDFQDKYNAAMERLRNIAGRDIGTDADFGSSRVIRVPGFVLVKNDF